MADTYGRGPNGEMLYPQDQYDQWGVFMGNRGPMVAGADTNTGDFNQWTSTLPFEEWAKNYGKVQLQRNRGNLGAEVTAPQGTPEYRQQIADRQHAAEQILGWGGTVGDMGIRPAKGAGLNLWNQYSGVKGGTLAPWAMNQARALYDRAARDRAAGIIHGPHGTSGGQPGNTSGNGAFGGSNTTGAAGSFTPGTGGVAANPMANPVGNTTLTTPTPARTPLLGTPTPGAPGSNPSPTPQDSYMQTPRGSRRGLRGLIGG